MKLPPFDHRMKTRAAAGLLVAVAAVLLLGTALGRERTRQRRDLEEQARMLADGLEAAMEVVPAERQLDIERSLASRFDRRGKLVGLAVYDERGEPVAASADVAARPVPPAVLASLQTGLGAGDYERRKKRALYVRAVPFRRGGQLLGAVALLYDTSFIEARVDALWRNNVQRWAIQGGIFVVAMVAMKGMFD